LLDLHSHTTVSDGYLSPSQRIDWYISQGINGAVISDHNSTMGAQLATDYVQKNKINFKVLFGQEYTASNLHLNIIGLKESISPKQYSGFFKDINEKDLQSLILNVKNKGGVVFVNHYNGKVDFLKEKLIKSGIDGFEISNGQASIAEVNIRDFCIINYLSCIGGSDIHLNYELNRFIKVKLKTDTFNYRSVFSNLKDVEHEVIRVDLYPEKIKFKKYISSDLGRSIILPISNFLNYLLNLNNLQLLSWWIWSFGVVWIVRRI
jgi:hypothetical protein